MNCRIMAKLSTLNISMLLFAAILLRLVHSQKPGRDCTSVEPKDRINCGTESTTHQQCQQNGCCYDNTMAGVIWCFQERRCHIPEGEKRQVCSDLVPVEERQVCSDPRLCLQRKWCYDPMTEDLSKKCYTPAATCSSAGIVRPHLTSNGRTSRPMQSGRGFRGPSDARLYSSLAAIITNCDVRQLILNKLYAYLLPRKRIESLTLSDVDSSTFGNLPATKRLILTRQTLHGMPHAQPGIILAEHLDRLSCPLLTGIPASVLPMLGDMAGDIDLHLAMKLCSCSKEEAGALVKVREVCKVIGSNLQSFNQFQIHAEKMCPECFIYIVEERPGWEDEIKRNPDMMSQACHKIGNTFSLPPITLSRWAHVCKLPTNGSGCQGLWPSFMPYQPTSPSPADIVMCKELFCSRLCRLTQDEMRRIQNVLNSDHNEDAGCLAYLDGMDTSKEGVTPKVDPASLPGSCVRRSHVIKRAQAAKLRRRKRSCSVSCKDIEFDISLDIDPPDVLDVTQINTCLETGNFSTCVEKNLLGDYRWDVNQARALFEIIRETRTVQTVVNWSGFDLAILGFIGVGFTPQELDTLDGFNNDVFAAFGAAYGWSPEQRRVLAQRYLRDNMATETRRLTNVDLLRLNHIVCGLTSEQIQDINLDHLADSMPVLGDMVRCDIDVIKVLAVRLLLYYGHISIWHEDYFSEFGILLAGIQGEDLRSVGTYLSDYVTVPFVNHIPPAEFRKLSTAQTSLFSYDVALACSRRGLCAWLPEPPQQGYLQALCPVSGVAFNTPARSLAYLLSVIVVTCVRSGGHFS